MPPNQAGSQMLVAAGLQTGWPVGAAPLLPQTPTKSRQLYQLGCIFACKAQICNIIAAATRHLLLHKQRMSPPSSLVAAQKLARRGLP